MNKENLKDPFVIPPGPYCYTQKGDPIILDGIPRIPIQRCPYWSLREDKPRQENGYCAFLERGDWEDGPLSLLWDQVKECGINSEEEEFEDHS